MRRSFLSRLIAALLAVWFVLSNGAEPSTMAGRMAGMGMGGMNMSGATMASMDMSAMDMSAMDMSPANDDAAPGTSKDTPQKSDEGCKQHDCCCSALTLLLLAPVASLAWLPPEIIETTVPDSGNGIARAEAQLRLPFANGPPAPLAA